MNWSRNAKFCLALFIASTISAVPSHAEIFDIRDVSHWIDYDFSEIVGCIAGPEGVTVFPQWDRERDDLHLNAILLSEQLELAIGEPVSARLQGYFDPFGMKPHALAFELELPVPLERIQIHLASVPEIRWCRPRHSDDVLDAALEVVSEEKGTVSLAVFADLHLLAEMFEDPGQVTSLRWVSREASLAGCP